MMTQAATNGHVPSEMIEAELSENQDSLQGELNGNGVVKSLIGGDEANARHSVGFRRH